MGLNAPRLSVGLHAGMFPPTSKKGVGLDAQHHHHHLWTPPLLTISPHSHIFPPFLQWAGPHQLAIKLRPLKSILPLFFFYYHSCIEISIFFLWWIFKQLFAVFSTSIVIFIFIIFLYPISYGCEASRHSILSSHFILTCWFILFHTLGIGMDFFRFVFLE